MLQKAQKITYAALFALTSHAVSAQELTHEESMQRCADVSEDIVRIFYESSARYSVYKVRKQELWTQGSQATSDEEVSRILQSMRILLSQMEQNNAQFEHIVELGNWLNEWGDYWEAVGKDAGECRFEGVDALKRDRASGPG